MISTDSKSLDTFDLPRPPADSRWKHISILLALFFVVLGARLWLVRDIGSSVPFWDQWNAEGWELFHRLLAGNWSWTSLYAPHNEHRIVLTRLLTIGLFQLDGMWDPRLEMTVNALIASITAVLVAHLTLLEIGLAWRRWVVSVVAILWSLPYGWENTTWGFQSQFYFLALFSFLGLWGLSRGGSFSLRWWIGAIGVMLACLSMASGMLAGLTIVAIRGFAIWLAPRAWREHWPAILLGLVCAGVSLLFAHHAPTNDPIRAQGVNFFLKSLAKNFSWPIIRTPLAFLLLQVPNVMLVRTLIRKRGDSAARWLPLSIAIWCALQAAALAYGRGFYGSNPISRYQDMLSLGFLAAFISLLLESHRIYRVVIYAWAIVALIGLVQETSYDVRSSIPEMHQHLVEQKRRCLAYIETQDPACFENLNDRLDIPFPSAERLKKFLDDPQLRSALVFVPGQQSRAGWPSKLSNFFLAISPGIFVVGILAIFVLFRRREIPEPAVP